MYVWENTDEIRQEKQKISIWISSSGMICGATTAAAELKALAVLFYLVRPQTEHNGAWFTRPFWPPKLAKDHWVQKVGGNYPQSCPLTMRVWDPSSKSWLHATQHTHCRKKSRDEDYDEQQWASSVLVWCVLREKKIQIGPRAECFSVLTTLEAEKQAAIAAAAAASQTNVEESIEEVHWSFQQWCRQTWWWSSFSTAAAACSRISQSFSSQSICWLLLL